MQEILLEFTKFIFLAFIIVIIAKYILVGLLRRLAETLGLKPRTVGNITGFATSVPEILTVSFSTGTGLIGAGIFNILSSNIINFLQYLLSIIINKNGKIIKNTAIKIDILLVIITIIIPILMIKFQMQTQSILIPVFILLTFLFFTINKNTHKKYLAKEEKELEEEIQKEEKKIHGKKRKTLFYIFCLILTSYLLFLIGDQLSNSLEMLCYHLDIKEEIVGILLGFVTSLPELITFFESQKHHTKENNSRAGVVEATNNLLSSNIVTLFLVQSISIIIFTITN